MNRHQRTQKRVYMDPLLNEAIGPRSMRGLLAQFDGLPDPTEDGDPPREGARPDGRRGRPRVLSGNLTAVRRESLSVADAERVAEFAADHGIAWAAAARMFLRAAVRHERTLNGHQ